MEDIAFIPLPQQLIMTIEQLREENETIQVFLERLIKNFIFQQDIELAQLEKMEELWDNEEDNIWDKMI